MRYVKSTSPLNLLLAIGILFSGCESSIVQDDPTPQAAIENESETSKYNLSLLPEITDFSNMRVGTYTGRYLIINRGGSLSRLLEGEIQKAGGEIVKSFPQIGVSVAVSNSPDFLTKARAISSVESVTPDFILQYTQEPEILSENSNLELEDINSTGEPFDYQSAFFDGFQWAPQSIDAPAAWENGFTGEGVRVAVIDGGFHSTHIDLQPNLDVASSISTVPGFNFNQDVGTFWHGTHVAGIVAASGLGMVGIAPKATIIGVKSLHNGSGAFEWILEGILYAATPESQGGAGAQVINMSLGATIPYRDEWKDKEFRDAFRELQKIYDLATRYAFQNGVTVVVSAGNGATNYDSEKQLYKIPAENQHVISISSTGPVGWALGNTNFSQPAYYTDYGKSLVGFAAPGGSAGLLVVDGFGGSCTVVGTNVSITNPCYAFDMVFSTVRGNSNGNYSWSQGTSMAAPAAAGVVALMIEASGGMMQPGLVKTRLANSATDLGKPGKDEFYGHGYVNAAKAVGLN
ncbi:MAG TPA: S8 family serine peptidase [Algoriphagus sp.]|nr:S8 family serine peptidase [Algoriphagus sp.]